MTALPQKLAFVDIETTGTWANTDRIIEIGVIAVENNQVQNKLSTLINPQTHISPYIEAMTGITSAQVENAPVFETVAKDLKELLTDNIFVAHNVRFDYGFIKREFARVGINFRSQKLCTVALARSIYPELPRHNLDTIISHFNIKCDARHRALGDAEVIWQFYKIIQESIPEDTLKIYLSHSIKKAVFPKNITKDQIDAIPNAPGVYIFLKKDGTVLYVGKSINLHERVLSHFTQNIIRTDFDIVQQVEDIEVIQTPGELGALLQESNLIKTLKPILNRKLRENSEAVALLRHTNTDGYDTIKFEVLQNVSVKYSNQILGVFKNKKTAINALHEIAKAQCLCPKLLGLENPQKACFNYQLGRCSGACIKKEKNYAYNVRLIQAFSKTRVKPWPFADKIQINEIDHINEKQEQFTVNNWCILKEGEDSCFDWDTYNILKRYLGAKKNQKNINAASFSTI